ncbi:helix-turn-helix transcriptional regulator [uncultured Chryseobacterium sp.]|uniref:helix-turn-helix domain-containing protein n=1 Tax=uncultured Chryseobacterium sp. TaxID=259322 RepID=UPI0025F05803|nr:helix-turn-helix transcriptional regulator [uncultured Chryseobacterium sp.]
MKKIKLIIMRKSKKITQLDMATYLKISQTQYYKRESGVVKISEQEWQKIATLLDVSVDDIFEEQDNEFNELSLKQELEYLKVKIKNIEQKLNN